MKTGTRGIDLIKSFETYADHAYKPTADDVPTIAFGHTRGVKMGDTCTRTQALIWLQQDLIDAEQTVNEIISLGTPLSQSMFDALVSLVFNVGPDTLNRIGTIGSALRSKDYIAAWRGFGLWINQNHKPLRGLMSRRAAEMALFVQDAFPSVPV